MKTMGNIVGSVFAGTTAKVSEDCAGSIERKSLREYEATFYTPEGQVNHFSATCPHMGCTVAYNSTEKTFDCPCHGSRFTGAGKAVNGPANKNLDQK
jgi:Rieske Fe-S protein